MPFSPAWLQATEAAASLAVLGRVEVQRFFGGAGLALNGVYFAFFMKGTLYLRTDAQTRPRFEALSLAPFSYATKAGRVSVSAYCEAPPEVQEGTPALVDWAREAYAAALRARRVPAGRASRPARAKVTTSS